MEDAMKKAMIFSILGIGAVTLSGCVLMPSNKDYVEVVDYQKIQLVESWARQHNTQVIWIATPMRKVPLAGS